MMIVGLNVGYKGYNGIRGGFVRCARVVHQTFVVEWRGPGGVVSSSAWYLDEAYCSDRIDYLSLEDKQDNKL